MRADLLLLRGPLLCMLLRHVTPDNAATDCSNDRVVAGIVSGHASYDRAFEAAGGIGCPGRRHC